MRLYVLQALHKVVYLSYVFKIDKDSIKAILIYWMIEICTNFAISPSVLKLKKNSRPHLENLKIRCFNYFMFIREYS